MTTQRKPARKAIRTTQRVSKTVDTFPAVPGQVEKWMVTVTVSIHESGYVSNLDPLAALSEVQEYAAKGYAVGPNARKLKAVARRLAQQKRL